MNLLALPRELIEQIAKTLVLTPDTTGLLDYQLFRGSCHHIRTILPRERLYRKVDLHEILAPHSFDSHLDDVLYAAEYQRLANMLRTVMRYPQLRVDCPNQEIIYESPSEAPSDYLFSLVKQTTESWGDSVEDCPVWVHELFWCALLVAPSIRNMHELVQFVYAPYMRYHDILEILCLRIGGAYHSLQPPISSKEEALVVQSHVTRLILVFAQDEIESRFFDPLWHIFAKLRIAFPDTTTDEWGSALKEFEEVNNPSRLIPR